MTEPHAVDGFFREAAAMWNAGQDTLAIADRFRIPEARVYGLLGHIKIVATRMKGAQP